jgi:effector-binding domain-containing protein
VRPQVQTIGEYAIADPSDWGPSPLWPDDRIRQSDCMRTIEISSRVDTEQRTAVMRGTVPVAEIGPWLGGVYGAVAQAVTASGAVLVGPPFARYRRDGDEFEIEAGLPIDRSIELASPVESSVLPGGTVATAIHVGPYDAMEPVYVALYEWVREHDAVPTGDPWEVYFTDPAAEPDPALWRTEVVLPYVSPSTP